jgi:acyl-CoA synthetase (AMP-forming)/AMP-acid ligase II
VTDACLTLAGRLKEIINRGGEKISPREVDEALMDHPAVLQAVAFAVPDAQCDGAFPYWRAIAMRIASSGETRWSELSAASAMASWTPLTLPLNALPREL